MARPKFTDLWTYYPKTDKPCGGPWANQCAIRMSIALNGEGSITVGEGTYSEPKCAHGHARGAQSLAYWLERRIGYARKWTDGVEAKAAIAKSSGIIFFKDCFQRDGEAEAIGDHIDLWRNGETKGFSDAHNVARQVWFWKL